MCVTLLAHLSQRLVHPYFNRLLSFMFLVTQTDFPYDGMTPNLLAKRLAEQTSKVIQKALPRNYMEVMILVENQVVTTA